MIGLPNCWLNVVIAFLDVQELSCYLHNTLLSNETLELSVLMKIRDGTSLSPDLNFVVSVISDTTESEATLHDNVVELSICVEPDVQPIIIGRVNKNDNL